MNLGQLLEHIANSGKIEHRLAGPLYCVNITDPNSQYCLKYMKYGSKLTDVVQLVDEAPSQIWGRCV